jgi:hypothetical protein
MGKDSKGYRHRLFKWIAATRDNPKGRLTGDSMFRNFIALIHDEYVPVCQCTYIELERMFQREEGDPLYSYRAGTIY